MKIKNFNEVAVTKLRKIALQIIDAGLQSIDTLKAIKNNFQLGPDSLKIKDQIFNLKEKNRLFIIGIGKCSLDAATALEEVLDEKITDGIVIDVREGNLKKLKTYTGSHPFPSQKNVDATGEIIKLLSGAKEDDLVLFIISGGGSTLLCQPQNSTCYDEGQVIECLFKSGAEIHEINTIRKHLSLARGGYLAKHAYPARAISIIFSDVPGDNLEFIASGPTIKDSTTLEDAKRVIAKYKIGESHSFIDESLIETPKEDKYFEKTSNILIVSNTIALQAMANASNQLGFSPKIRTSTLKGEARNVALEILQELDATEPKTALLYGGETTVTIKHPGKGGRNLELSLAGLQKIKDNQLLLSVASDGRDNTDFAGGICDIITKEKAEGLGLDTIHYLNENNSYEFFAKTDQKLQTGSTGSNVSDLIIAIKD